MENPWCGASTCGIGVEILSFRNGRMIVQAGLGMAWPELSLVATGGVTDIVLHGGGEGSIGAQPTRTRTDRYRWTGRELALVDRQWDASPYLIHAVYDALDAETSGDLDKATAGFQRVISDDILEAARLRAGQDDERQELAAFARLHLGLVELQRAPPNAGAARAVFTEAARLGGATAMDRATAVFILAWNESGDPARACRSVRAVIDDRPSLLDTLNDYGYSAANRTLTAADVCPIGAFATDRSPAADAKGRATCPSTEPGYVPYDEAPRRAG